jgi:hypothetical protein
MSLDVYTHVMPDDEVAAERFLPGWRRPADSKVRRARMTSRRHHHLRFQNNRKERQSPVERS